MSLHVRNTSHGTINTHKEGYSESIPISVIKLLLHMTMYKAPDGGLEDNNTDYF